MAKKLLRGALAIAIVGTISLIGVSFVPSAKPKEVLMELPGPFIVPVRVVPDEEPSEEPASQDVFWDYVG